MAWSLIVNRHNRCTEKPNLGPEAIQLELSHSVKRLALPGDPGESVKSCIRRVAAKTGLGFDQIRRLWYLRWRLIPAHVADTIREAENAHQRRQDAEWETIKARYWALSNQSSDPEFYSQRTAEALPPVDKSS
jgi:hypothetical protein